MSSHSMSPGDPTYRSDISDSLMLRWSTSADRAGCTFLSCLAPGLSEGKEFEFALRYFEPYTQDSFHAGSSTNWAVCVDRTPPDVAVEVANDSPYMANLRKEVLATPERVVALVYYLPAEFAFEQDSSRVAVGKAQIVACKRAYRQGTGGSVNIMKGLFQMVHDRARLDRCAFMITSGIPAYYRTHGYEYALEIGQGLVTQVSSIPPPGKTASAESPYTMRAAILNDLPTLESLTVASRGTAALFSGVSGDTLRSQLQWILGQRQAPFDDYQWPMHDSGPFLLLEKEGRCVAATGLMKKPSAKTPGHVITVHPVLWDGSEDASATAVALLQHLVPASNKIMSEDEPAEVEKIRWLISEDHPLRRWLLAHELATPAPRAMTVDSSSNWWINIPSLPIFFETLKEALDKRLSRATHLFGKNYTAELRIGEFRSSTEGVIVKIRGCALASVDAYKLTPSDLNSAAFAFGTVGPNVALPRGALIQLLMGNKTWSELRALHPDVVAVPSLVPLVEVLFPKIALGSSLYL